MSAIFSVVRTRPIYGVNHRPRRRGTLRPDEADGMIFYTSQFSTYTIGYPESAPIPPSVQPTPPVCEDEGDDDGTFKSGTPLFLVMLARILVSPLLPAAALHTYTV